MPWGVYATFEEVKAYLQDEKSANFLNKDNGMIMQRCVEMSRKFDAHCKRHFYPLIETRYYDHPHEQTQLGGIYRGLGPTNPNLPQDVYGLSYDARRLELDEDLLEVITLKTENGNTTISSDDYYLKTGDSYNYMPYDNIELTIEGSQQVFNYLNTWKKANEVEGVWGYHEQYADAWQQVDSVQDAGGITAAATTVSVADADGEDEQGLEPRFKAQQLIRFGSDADSEMAYVIKPGDPDNNEITVKRGVNGSTAAIQAKDTAIYVWRPMPEIHHALLALTAWAYRRKDNVGSSSDQPIASSTGVILMPPVLPREITSMIDVYTRKLYRS